MKPCGRAFVAKKRAAVPAVLRERKTQPIIPPPKMPAFSKFLRRVLQLSIVAGASLVPISCATKKEKKPAPAPAVAGAKKNHPKPAPAPAGTPAPKPTPQATYVASVKVDGGETVSEVIAPDGQTTPAPTPAASPTPAPSPSPTPKPGPLNFLTQTWAKVFPPKPTPAPTPGETGRVTISVTSPDGGRQEEVAREGSVTGPGANSAPTPAPIMIKLRPQEGIMTRMWHMVFPKKKEPPVAAPPQWIGTIKLVNERDGYALIDSQDYGALPTGETLNAIGNDSESGVLRVTTDRNPPFFIADIVSGKPRAGDRVYSPKP